MSLISGLANKVKAKAQDAVDTVKDAAGSVKDAATTAAAEVKQAAATVTDGVEKTAQAVAPDAIAKLDPGPMLARAKQVPADVASKLAGEAKSAVKSAELAGTRAMAAANEVKSDVGAAIKDTGARITETGRDIKKAAEGIKGAAAGELQNLGEKAASLGQQLSKLKDGATEKAGELAKKASDVGEKVKGAAEKLAEAAKPQPLVNPQILKDAGQKLIHHGKNLLEAVEQRTNPAKQVDGLQNGDKFTVSSSGGGNVDIPGAGGLQFKAGQKVQVEVERKDVVGPDGKVKLDDKGNPIKKFNVSYDAEQTGGAAINSKSGHVGADGQVGGGARVEYSFDNEADAKRGIELMNRQIAQSAKHEMRANMEPALSDADYAFLKQHTSAVEVRGVGAMTLAGELGPNLGPKGAAKLQVKGEPALRIEYANGEPSKAVLKTTLTAEGQAQVNASMGDKNGTGSHMGPAANGKAQVTVEQRFDLPKGGIDRDKLLSDPNGQLGPYVAHMKKNQQVTVTGSVEGLAHAAGNGYGIKREVSVQGPPDKVLQPEVLGLMAQGRNAEAAKKLGPTVSVTTSQRTYEQTGVHINPEISVAGHGKLGWEFQSTKQHTIENWPSRTLTADQAAKELDAWEKDQGRALTDATRRASN